MEDWGAHCGGGRCVWGCCLVVVGGLLRPLQPRVEAVRPMELEKRRVIKWWKWWESGSRGNLFGSTSRAVSLRRSDASFDVK